MIYQILEKGDPYAYSSSVSSPCSAIGMGQILYLGFIFL